MIKGFDDAVKHKQPIIDYDITVILTTCKFPEFMLMILIK